jgi:hypothetical protein
MFNFIDIHIDMKQINEKFKRTMKYWRVRYQQSSQAERLNLYLFAFLVLSYAWWLLLVL